MKKLNIRLLLLISNNLYAADRSRYPVFSKHDIGPKLIENVRRIIEKADNLNQKNDQDLIDLKTLDKLIDFWPATNNKIN